MIQMFFSIFSVLIGFLISFSPPTAIVGIMVAFVLSFIHQKNTKNNLRTQDAVYSIIGLALGAVAGLTVYGRNSYMHQWSSLWWIPTLWLVGSSLGLIMSTIPIKR
ncbi:hypothetical protein [Thermococcus sp.]|uniref:hypothetical protein n=1 Tax=Thermococcus sp. TaxID=35749 RepID=UPI0026336783|nr:hypothetical protein [Thermococcus sp.]